MTKRYYAIANVNGPISVRLPGSTLDEARAALAALSVAECVEAYMDVEDDLGIDGENMTEDQFAAVLTAAGAVQIEPCQEQSGHDGRAQVVAGDWWLWSVTQSTEER